MGEIVDLQEYREKLKKIEEDKIEEEIEWLKKKLEDSIKEKTISIFPEDEEYYHWHPPGIISRGEEYWNLENYISQDLDGYFDTDKEE